MFDENKYFSISSIAKLLEQSYSWEADSRPAYKYVTAPSRNRVHVCTVVSTSCYWLGKINYPIT
jgi:hypothetical protein